MNKPGFLLPVPAAPPDEAPLHTCSFGAAWLPLVLEALNDLVEPGVYENPPADISSQVSHLIAQIQEASAVPDQIFPTAAIHFHTLSRVLNGAPIPFTVISTQMFGHYARQTPPDNLDEFEFEVLLEAGDYECHICSMRNTDQGVFEFWDGTGILVTADLFGAAQMNYLVIVPLTVAASGQQRFRGKVNGKNAGSSNYRATFTYFKFVQV